MITVNLFTSGRHTQPLIDALKKAKNIKLANIYSSPPDSLDKLDIFIVADFGQIIPQKILEIPKYGALCVHPSLLPKYRGASPIQRTILNGETETGVTIFKMDEKVDHGPIIAQLKEKIRDDDTAETLLIRLFTLGSRLLLKILPDYLAGKIKPEEQNHSRAAYTHILKKEDGKINCLDLKEAMEAGGSKAVEIERKIRAFTPWPGVWTEIEMQRCKDAETQTCLSARQGCKEKISGSLALWLSESPPRRLKLLKAHLETTWNMKHETRNMKLVLDQVQLEGKKPVSWKQFKEGYPEAKFI